MKEPRLYKWSEQIGPTGSVFPFYQIELSTPIGMFKISYDHIDDFIIQLNDKFLKGCKTLEDAKPVIN